MGKVLKSFNNGFAGAIARSKDDIVIAMANKSGDALAFGVPVALDDDKTGIVPFDGSEHSAADFVGVTVRNPSKTPDTYGKNVGTYAKNDMVDVLVRGHIIVKLSDSSAGLGDKVGIAKDGGTFTVRAGNDYVTLNNVHVTAVPDTSSMAEIVLNERNLV